jgi:hypothetical protein
MSNTDGIHENRPGERSAESELVFDRWGGQAFHTLQ